MSAVGTRSIAARPEPFAADPRRMAVIVVDMQNGFAAKGGFLERAGFDISGARATIANCRRVVAAARAAGSRIVHLQMGWHRDLRDAGAVGGGMWHKSVALRYMRAHPENNEGAILRGTWDYAIVDELAPEAGDIVVAKTRLSGFFETNLDSTLRALGIDALAFVGIATNVCVEATLRDGLYRDYRCLLVADATNAAGPDFVKQASIFNVEMILGWVTTADDFCKALAP